MRFVRRRTFRTILCVVTVGTVAAFTVPWLAFRISTRGVITDVAKAPKAKVVLVLGAGLRADGKPSAVLSARVRTAVSL